jgi:hypothetical protein
VSAISGTPSHPLLPFDHQIRQPWWQPTTACSELHKPVQLFKFSGET